MNEINKQYNDENKIKTILIWKINWYKIINPIDKIINIRKADFFYKIKNNVNLKKEIHNIIYYKLDILNNILLKKINLIKINIINKLILNNDNNTEIYSLEDILIKKEIKKLKINNLKIKQKLEHQNIMIDNFKKKIQLFVKNINLK